MLATDLDKTLLGDSKALKKINKIFSGLREKNKLKLVYVTARSIESYNELILNETLLVPDALICSVGTEIYIRKSMRKMPNWPIAIDWDTEFINSHLANLPGLTKQPSTEQREYKVSYFLDNNYPSLQEVRDILGGQCEVIYSNTKYLDVLPKGIHKGSAIKFLADSWEIDHSNIIACGDSANDISMIEGNNAIVVGNAQMELLEWLSLSSQPKAYIATQRYANGMVEGLKHFGIN